LLQDERTENGGYVVNVSDTSRGVVVELKGGETYEMRAAKVGVGENVDDTEAEYIVKRAGERTVPQGTVIYLVAKVRDGYNNPVGGATVNAEVLTGGNFESGGSTADATTDGNGRARFTYDVEPGENEVRASINGDTAAYENVTFELTGFGSTASGGGGGGAYDTFWVDPTGNETLDVAQDGQTLDLTMGTNPVADGANVEYSVNDTTVGNLSVKTGTTDTNGNNITRLNAKRNGTVKVYTSSGGSGDVVNVTIENVPSMPIVYNDDASSYIDSSGVQFTITNQGGDDLVIEDMVIESPSGGGASQIRERFRNLREVTIGNWNADEYSAYQLGNSVDDYEVDEELQYTIQAGETQTVTMYQFQNSGGQSRDMTGRTIPVTFYFQNEDPVTFNITP
jgi:hypothetical protein